MKSALVAVALSVVVVVPPRAMAAGPSANTGAAPAVTRDDLAAEALFDEGKALMASQEFDAACAKFAASNALSPGIGTTLWLADCHERAGRLASAWYVFREAASMADARADRRRDVANAKATALAPRLTRLRVEAKPGVAVTRNGAPVKPEELFADVPVDPGVAHIEARAKGKRPWSTRIDLRREGKTTRVVVPELEDDPAAALSTRRDPGVERAAAAGAAPSSRSPLAPLGVAGIALGAASIVASGVLGLVAKGRAGEADDGHCGPGNVCDARGVELRAQALDLARVATGLFVAGAAVGAAGGGAFAVAPRAEIAPGGGGAKASAFVSLRGTF